MLPIFSAITTSYFYRLNIKQKQVVGTLKHTQQKAKHKNSNKAYLLLLIKG
jgi:hypothetical protein